MRAWLPAVLVGVAVVVYSHHKFASRRFKMPAALQELIVDMVGEPIGRAA